MRRARPLNSEIDAKQTELDVEGKAIARSPKRRAQQLTLSGEPEKKSQPDPRNRLNDLSNREWIYFTRSVWFTTLPRELGFELRGKHGGNKPPTLLKDIIQFFTKRGETVLDPMSGVGGTLLGASLCDRRARGIEINDSWTRIYEQVCRKHNIQPQEVTSGDCLEVMARMRGRVDLVVVDPPYRESTFNPKVSGVRKQAIANGDRMTSLTDSFSKDGRDFGNSASYEDYQGRLAALFQQCYRVLHDGRYLIVFTKDEFRDGAYFELSSEIARLACGAGFKWVGKISWFQAGAPLRPYGLPFTYVPNFIDQKILVLKKDGDGAQRSTESRSPPH